MAGSLLPQPKQTFSDNAGKPLVGGQIYTYAAGSLTPKATYQDAALTIANTNPIIINARGEVIMYGSGAYRVILKDAAGNTIWDQDNVESPASSAATGLTGLAASLAGAGGAALVGFQAVNNGLARVVQDKLRDTVSPRDFGAKGDGATDDTAAFQAAINTGAHVLTQKGDTHKISAALTVSTDAQRIYGGAKVVQATNKASIFIVTANHASIEGMELQNTGTADSSALPTTYGAGIILKDTIGAKAINNKLLNCSSAAANYGAAIWLTDAQDSIVTGNHIDGAYMGINTDTWFQVQPSRTNLIGGNTVKNAKRGYVLDLQGTQADASRGDIVRDNRFYGATDTGITIDLAKNGAEVVGNVIEGSSTDGSAGIKLVHATNYVIISQNRITGHNGIGIAINGIDGSVPAYNTISGNFIAGNVQDGIQLYTVDKMIIEGNQIVKNGRAGIASVAQNYPRDLRISHNLITGNTNEGIYLVDANDINIFGNSIYGNSAVTSNTYCGIKVASLNLTPKNIQFVNNMFFMDYPGYVEKQKYAIAADNTANSKAINNKIGTQATAGFYDPNSNLFRGLNDPDNGFSNITINGGKIYGSPTMPTSGVYNAGERVNKFGTMTVQGAASSQYVMTGWLRLTTGSTHVLNTDWVEMRTLTGT